ncbi:MAG: type II toxin-antitoxin system RelE/ParE family toxin [Candidatus Schekmanbacteria bacterium]|nr:type II toxin-antitoxin system RelE/ParE family toxin [Candidatus Schekmanbacteria bacterium]
MQEKYKIILLPVAQKDLNSQDKILREKLISKIVWLSIHPEVLGQCPLSGLPPELKGLCKYRIGDYRIIYKVSHNDKIIKVYAVKHRSQVYKDLKNI